MATQIDIRKDGYDRKIIPAEIAARRDREGEDYKQLPESDGTSTDTTGGYTMDERGLTNNYANEPEVYYDHYPSNWEQSQYMKQGTLAAAFVAVVLMTAVVVTSIA